jgi:hypothetical protein
MFSCSDKSKVKPCNSFPLQSSLRSYNAETVKEIVTSLYWQGFHGFCFTIVNTAEGVAFIVRNPNLHRLQPLHGQFFSLAKFGRRYSILVTDRTYATEKMLLS